MRSKIAICQEWFGFGKKKEQEKDLYEVDFVIDGGCGYNCNTIQNIIINLYGEDRDSGAVNVFWNYKDEVYDYLYYANLSDSYNADECENLLYNFDYFFKDGENKAIQAFKRNLSKKSLPFKFEIDKGVTKNEFRAELTYNLRNVIDEIDIITDTVLKDLKEENESSSHVSGRKSVLVGKFNKYISQVNSLADLLWGKITKSPKADIAQEGLFDVFKKKEDASDFSNDFTDIAEIWLKVNSYKKDMVAFYEKAIESYAKDVLKFSPSVGELSNASDMRIANHMKDISKATLQHATSTSSPINACRKAFEAQLRSIGLDLKKIDTSNNIVNNVCLYWYPGEDGIYSFYKKEDMFVLTTTYDGYSRIVAAFKNMDKSKLTNVFSILLKDIDSCIEKGYEIKTPTLDKLYNIYVDSQTARKHWDDKCELVCTSYYGFIRQGMYLHNPKFTKDKLSQDLKNIASKYGVEL